MTTFYFHYVNSNNNVRIFWIYKKYLKYKEIRLKWNHMPSHFLWYPIFDRVIYIPKICRNIRNRNNIPFRFSYCAIENAIIFLWRRRFHWCFERETAISTRVPPGISSLASACADPHADLISNIWYAIFNLSFTLINRQTVSIHKRIFTFMKINWFSHLDLIKYFKTYRVLWKFTSNAIDVLGFWVAHISRESK